MKIGEIRGIELRISKLLPVLFLIYFVLGVGQKALLVFTVILVHELGHVFLALFWGVKVNSIELFPLGGVARMEKIYLKSIGKEIIFYLGGPLVNLFLAGVVGLALYFNFAHKDTMSFLFQVNLAIGGFNLIPAWPLDGGRIFRAVLSHILGYLKAARIASLFGQVWAGGFFIFGALMITENPANFYWWVIAIYLYYLNRREKRLVFLNYLRYLTQKDKEIEIEGFLPAVVLVSLAKVSLYKVIERLTPHRYHIICVLDQKGNFLGLITEKTIINLTLKGSMFITLEEVIDKKDK